MRLIVLLILFTFVCACGKKESSAGIIGLNSNGKDYRGYSIIGASQKCPIPSRLAKCSDKINEKVYMQRDFAQICESKNLKAYDCGCQNEYICSGKIDVLVSGYTLQGKKWRGIPHEDIIYCPDGGSFLPSSDEIQESFRSRCESLGHKAILVGCLMKKYLCTQKI